MLKRLTYEITRSTNRVWRYSFGKKRAALVKGFVNSGSSVVHKTFTSYKEQKSCYRFLSNPRVKESILINQLRQNCLQSVEGKDVLAICDTSVVNINPQMGRISDFEGLGITSRRSSGVPSYGYYMHPIYVIDSNDGTPYGIADVKMFNRSMEQNTMSISERKRFKRLRSIEQKESYKWVGPCIKSKEESLGKAKRITYVMDREADIWEVFDRLPDARTHLVVRSKTNRNILNRSGEHTRLHKELANQTKIGQIDLELPGKSKNKVIKQMDLRCSRCKIIPSQFNPSNTPVALSYVEIKETKQSTAPREEPIHWILWTDRKVETLKQAKEIIEIYTRRWSIEVFFKLLKSDGFDIERSQLETGKALRKLALIIMNAAIRVLQLKAARSGDTDLKVKDVFNPKEIRCLKLLNKQLQGSTRKQQNPYNEQHLAWASWIIGRLAGWTAFYDKTIPLVIKCLPEGLKNLMTS